MTLCQVFPARTRRKYRNIVCVLLFYTCVINAVWYCVLSELWNREEVKKLALRELRRSKGILYTESIKDHPVDYFIHGKTPNSSGIKVQIALETSVQQTKYLVPILLGNQGPNNQMQSLKLSAVIAAHRDRTLVRTPFFGHFSQDEYSVRNFNETLDVRLFNKLTPTESIEDFYRNCGGKIDVVFSGVNWSSSITQNTYNKTMTYVNTKMKIWSEITGIDVPDMLNEPDRVIDLPDNIPDGYHPLRTLIDTTDIFKSDSKCVGIAYPYGMLGRFYYHDYVSVLSKYVTRPPDIRRATSRFMRTVLHNKQFLGFHWRYNKEWTSQWCHRNTENAKQKCRLLDQTSNDVIIKSVQSIVDEFNLEAVYLATPLGANDPLVNDLLTKVPNLYTKEDLFDSNMNELNTLKHNSYRLSLVEQELCKQSTVFLASRLSSWSDIVAEDRNRRQVMYVPDVLKT
ncbi:uncharacterized protein LOC100370893 [Saccoglossus kowalevskii]|uniref:GDP-fucose protein O-fucosyltransferase 2 n=1 Tax=Saccoglossus kowalevskii TaxID=10224 RepID=A0ABM0GKG1_SACKO|nr:PREDICTED: uncharacterized protein LOC100370893 [Saccoglossus kowalevskii]